jgi:hypothetical protein
MKNPFIFLTMFQTDYLLLKWQDNTSPGCIYSMRKRRSSLSHYLGRSDEIFLRGTAKIDEYATQFDQYNMKFAKEIKGFDPNHLFHDHMVSVGFSNTLINTFIFGEEEGDNHDPPAECIERKAGDIETIISTTDQYKKKGKPSNEKNAQSPIISQKSTLSKNNSQSTTSQQKKSSMNNSDDGGDKNPPQGKLEKSHKLQVKRKRTNSQQEIEEHIPESEIHLEDMDLEVDIENIQFPDDEERVQENIQSVAELAIQDEEFSEEESFSIHNALFDKDSRKLIFERTLSKNKKGKTCSTFNLNNMLPSGITKIHKVTGDALDVSIDDMEAENARLKERIQELEFTLMPPPILATPVATVQPGRNFEKTPESSIRLKGTSSLLVATRHYVEQNIKKIMSLILNTWDLASSFVSLGSKIQNTREYLKADIENDEGFFKDGLATFIMKVSTMTEYERKQEDLPSQAHIKKLKACWIQRINVLRELSNELNDLTSKKTEAYSKLTGLDLAGKHH